MGKHLIGLQQLPFATIVELVLPGALAAAGVWLLTPWTTPLALRLGAIDQPGPRKIHTTAIPRLGGVAVIAIALAVWQLMQELPWVFGRQLSSEFHRGMLAGLIPVFVVSFIDDLRPVRATWKLLMQCIGALIAVSLGVRLGPEIHLFDHVVEIGYLAIPLSVLWIVAVTNAFNLSDGLDGLCAGLALVSSLSLAALGFVVGGWPSVSTAVVLVGALLGFLPYNLYPAKVFLGDAGAASIGFCLACLALRSGSALSSGMAIMVPVFVMGVPLAETAVSVLRRVVGRLESAGRSGVLQADCNHIHHRLLRMGLDQRRAVLFLYWISGAAAALGLVSMFMTARNAGLLFAGLLAAAFIGVRRLGYDEFAIIRRGVLLRFYDQPVLKMSLFPVFVDMSLVAVAVYTAIGLKYDDWSLSVHRQLALDLIAVLPLVAVCVFAAAKLYYRSWRHASVEDLVRASIAVLVASATGMAAARLVGDPVTISLFGIYGMMLLILFNGARSSYRVLSYWRQSQNARGGGVVIYGAGAGGAMALRELRANRDLGMRPIGFIDDDPARIGRYLNGYPVLGSGALLEQVIASRKVKGVIVASEKIPHHVVSQLRQTCERAGIWLMRFRIGFSLDYCPAEQPEPVAPPERPAAVALSASLPDSAATPPSPAALWQPTSIVAWPTVCPRCRSDDVHRSRAHTTWEWIRQHVTRRRPYRCHACGWRGWAVDSHHHRFTEEDLDLARRALAVAGPALDDLVFAPRARVPEVNLESLDSLAVLSNQRPRV